MYTRETGEADAQTRDGAREVVAKGVGEGSSKLLYLGRSRHSRGDPSAIIFPKLRASNPIFFFIPSLFPSSPSQLLR